MAASTMHAVVSVVLCTHAPHSGRLRRTLTGLATQRVDFDWDLLIVDNASSPPLTMDRVQAWPELAARTRIVVEPHLGLSYARARGFRESQGRVIILVDDDNVLAEGYLATAVAELDAHPDVGLTGGAVVAEFESAPPRWMDEFLSLLALRDLGACRIEQMPTEPPSYPTAAPVGAGMVLRRECAEAWLDAVARRSGRTLSDRSGSQLSSSGDNDIVMCNVGGGWSVSYVPALRLTHLIPASRTTPEYLARLNEGIQASWTMLLRMYGISPWPAITSVGARLRRYRAWFSYQAWRSDAHRIRWRGACGQFAGRAVPLVEEGR